MRYPNIQFFKTKKDCKKTLLSLAEVGDGLTISRGEKGQPLWGQIEYGYIKNISKKKVDFSSSGFLPKTLNKFCSYTFDNKERGFRLDKNWVFYRANSNKDRDITKPIKALQCNANLIRFTNKPEHHFIHRSRVGDYVTIYSCYDNIIENFLHYPCIGWLLTKDIKNKTVTVINPPNMKPKTYKVTGKEQAFYIFRKFVLQVGKE